MSKRSNTFPYTNARREGRTNPDLIEVRQEIHVPSLGPIPGAGRLRRYVKRTRAVTRLRHAPAREWPPTPTDAERLALWNWQQARGYQTKKPCTTATVA